MEGILPKYRKSCDNRPFCFAYAHTEVDPCPTVSKYLEIIYSCEQKGGLVLLYFDLHSLKNNLHISWTSTKRDIKLVLFCDLAPPQCVCTAWVSRMGISQTPSFLLLLLLVSSLPTKPVWMEILAGCRQETVCTNLAVTHTKSYFNQ